MQTKTCCYLLNDNGKNVRCDKKTSWRIVLDDDDNRYRKYNPFCDEHQKIVDALPPIDDDEEF